MFGSGRLARIIALLLATFCQLEVMQNGACALLNATDDYLAAEG